MIKAARHMQLNGAQERARKRVALDKDTLKKPKHRNQPSIDSHHSRRSSASRPTAVMHRHGLVDCFIEERETQLASANVSAQRPLSRYESAVHAFKTQGVTTTQHRRYYSDLSSQQYTSEGGFRLNVMDADPASSSSPAHTPPAR